MLAEIAALAGGAIGRDWATRDAATQAQANERGAERAMDFSSAEALANRDWQEKMSNTAWQRGTADMMAAGINPMLSFMKGGASTPSGGQGSSTPAQGAPTRSSGELNVTPAMETAARIANINADTENKKAENPNIRNQARIQDATVENLKEQTAQLAKQQNLTEAQTAQVKQVIDNLKREWANLGLKGEQITEETVLTFIRQSVEREHIRDVRVRMTLNLLDIPEALAKAREMQGNLGVIKPYLSSLGSLVHSAADAKRAFSPATQTFRSKR